MRYKNIVFDVGHVLLSYRWKDMMIGYGLSAEEADRFYQMTCKDPLWEEFDLENIPFDAVVEMFVEKYPDSEEALRYFFEHKELMPVPRNGVYKRCEELLNLGKCLYILSNYSGVLFEAHTKKIPFMDRVSGKMVSYMIHIGKPDHRIYKSLYEKYSISPEESLFFDDRAENVEAARETGMDAVFVESEEMLEKSLDELIEKMKME